MSEPVPADGFSPDPGAVDAVQPGVAAADPDPADPDLADTVVADPVAAGSTTAATIATAAIRAPNRAVQPARSTFLLMSARPCSPRTAQNVDQSAVTTGVSVGERYQGDEQVRTRARARFLKSGGRGVLVQDIGIGWLKT